MAAVKDAGVTQIDHLVTTHFHTDHIGAMPELTSRISVRHFIDPGPNVEARMNDFVQKIYPPLYAKGTRTIAKAGDRIPMKGLDVRIPTAAGAAIKSALPGAGKANPYCAQFKPQAPDTTENAMSVGTHVTFGRFRLLHLGGLTRNEEFELMCPSNPLGTIDLLVGSHHSQAISNSAVRVHAIEPRVVLMNNGIRKGGQEYTVPSLFIANLVDEPPADMPIAPMTPPGRGAGGPPPVPAPIHNGPAFWVKVSAKGDGSFTVTNARNGFSKTYAAQGRR
jgi:competence protein ComEC